MKKCLLLYLFLLAYSFTYGQGLDIYVVTQGDPDILCLNDGLGNLQCDTLSDSGALALSVLAADFDGDGRDDILRTVFGRPSELCSGIDGGLDCNLISTDASVTYGATAFDADSDGDLDLALAIGFGPNLLCINTEADTFACAPFDDDNSTTLDAVSFDANGDGHEDVIYANRGNGGVTQANVVCLSDGAGLLSCTPFADDTTRSFTVAAGDFNTDGITDVVFGNGDEQLNRVCFGRGDGSFVCRLIDTSLRDTRGVAVADFDQDGIDDIVFANSSLQVNRICFSNGDSTFLCQDLAPNLTLNSTGTGAHDIDADGDQDIIFTNFNRTPLLGLNDGEGNFTFENLGTFAGTLNDVAFFRLDRTTSTHTIHSPSGIQLFPNPTKNRVYILNKQDRRAPQQAEIYNMLGQLCQRQYLDGGTIQLGGLAAGAYLVRIMANDGSIIGINRILRVDH
ncbi:MAG: T9SS type A sorting domain-containing protein [Bacteroidota bacterium]